MKKRNRFAAAALAALLLAGSAPSALALDTTPPMYQQFGYDSAEEYMEQESSYGVFDYDTLSDHYRQHLDAIHKDPQIAVDYWGYDDLEGLSFGWDGDLEECYRDTARAMTEGDEYKLRCQLSVQLNGAYVHFADAQPEKVNGRVMVPFRAIAEATEEAVLNSLAMARTVTGYDGTVKYSLADVCLDQLAESKSAR